MRFISQHTSIPVPKVLCAFTRSGWTYIVMERIRGDIIGEGWVNRSEDSKAKLLSQLAEKIREMRELQPIQNFHRHLRMGMDFDSRVDLEIQELIKQQSKTWPLVFTHGDLSSLNILARRDDIVGIIDWETAGWYPSYWEYTSAYQVNPQNSFWVNEIDKFLQPMSKELAMEQIRQKYFGDV
ncbi:Aminoglycoside phosphotransferase [Penicillium cf. griseofulvum]|nr:Aminoglycoside phosphotransferase [Penicillium cf. griseofulvum]